MVQSSTKALPASVAAKNKANQPSQRMKFDTHNLSSEAPKRNKMGVEELRLSRVDVRERQKRFEKMESAQDKNKPRAVQRSRSEDNHRIKATKVEPRGKSESLDRMNGLQLKDKKMNIVATSTKRQTSFEKVNNNGLSRKQDINPPKAWVQPLKREPVEAAKKRSDPIPIPVKQTNILKEKATWKTPIPVENGRLKTEQHSKGRSPNIETASHPASLNKGKSQSMIITVASRSCSNDVKKQDGRKPIIRVNSKVSDKSSKSVKVNFKSPESSEKPNVNSKKEQDTENSRKALEVKNIRQEDTKERTESTSSTSSYYRDVRESLGNQNTSSPSGKNELLANIMAVENSEMAKALGLSEELIQLIKEEEQFWNRQVELKKWRESQEQRHRDISRVFDTDKEKRIAELRKEHKKTKSPELTGQIMDKADVEKLRLAEERFLSEEADRLKMLAAKEQKHRGQQPSDFDFRHSKQSHHEHESENERESQYQRAFQANETDGKIYLKQSLLNGETVKTSRNNNKRQSYPQGQMASSRVKSRYSDIDLNSNRLRSGLSEVVERVSSSYDQYSHDVDSDQKDRQRSRHSDHGFRYKNSDSRESSHDARYSDRNSRPSSRDAPGDNSSSRHTDNTPRSFSHDSLGTNPGSRYPEHIPRPSSTHGSRGNHDTQFHDQRTYHVDNRGIPHDTDVSDRMNDYQNESRPLHKNKQPKPRSTDTDNSRRSDPGIQSRNSHHDDKSHLQADNEPGTEYDSGIDHLKKERVFSEQSDGKVRTYHVTSVAVRYSRGGSLSSSSFRVAKSEPDINIDNEKQSTNLKIFKQDEKIHYDLSGMEANVETERPSMPTGWLSEDDDVFMNRHRSDMGSPRGCFSDDEMVGEYFREKLRDARLVRLDILHRIRCTGCSCLIRESEAMSVAGKEIYWHVVCFNCTVCGIVLVSRKSGHFFKVRIINGRLHCSSCYSTNGDRLSEV